MQEVKSKGNKEGMTGLDQDKREDDNKKIMRKGLQKGKTIKETRKQAARKETNEGTRAQQRD